MITCKKTPVQSFNRSELPLGLKKFVLSQTASSSDLAYCIGLHLVAWGQTGRQSLCLLLPPRISPLQGQAIVQNDYASHGCPAQNNDSEPDLGATKKGHILLSHQGNNKPNKCPKQNNEKKLGSTNCNKVYQIHHQVYPKKGEEKEVSTQSTKM